MNAARTVLTALMLLASFWPSFAFAAEWTVMLITWRGCEEACRGFQDELKDARLDVNLLLRDAARDPSQLARFLAEARAEQVDLIVTWGTSVTSGIAGTLADIGNPDVNNDIPQVFMIVADPVGAGIIESLDAPGRPNITGTFNRVPEQVTIATIRRYRPGFSHLGMLYNSSEENSVLKVGEMTALADELGYAITAIDVDEIGGAEAIAPGMAMLSDAGVDFVYLGSSSFLRSNAELVGAAAVAAQLPLLTPYEDMVQNGHALISVAARYYDVGRLAGQQAEKVLLGGMVAGPLPVARMSDFALVVNMSVAEEISALPPIEILQFAEIVE